MGVRAVDMAADPVGSERDRLLSARRTEWACAAAHRFQTASRWHPGCRSSGRSS